MCAEFTRQRTLNPACIVTHQTHPFSVHAYSTYWLDSANLLHSLKQIVEANPQPSSLASTLNTQPSRCRANVAHTRQSRPDYGPGFKVKVIKRFEVFPFRSDSAEPHPLVGRYVPAQPSDPAPALKAAEAASVNPEPLLGTSHKLSGFMLFSASILFLNSHW